MIRKNFPTFAIINNKEEGENPMKRITYQMTKLVAIKNLREQSIITNLFNTIGIITRNHLNIFVYI
jgi:hypothetical protein